MSRWLEFLIKVLFLWPYIGLGFSLLAIVYCLVVGITTWWYWLIAAAIFGYVVYRAHFG